MSVAFIDVSAGFDTEPHSFRLRKQQMIGYAESTLDWVASYLRGRTMRVRIECSKSTPEVIRKGVPQGGPGSPCTLDIPMTLYMCKE